MPGIILQWEVMHKSDTVQPPFSSSFWETQDDLWFSGMGKKRPREGLGLARVTQQVGGKVSRTGPDSNLEAPLLSKQLTGSLGTLLWVK